VGSALKHGAVNDIPPVDPCTLAMELGCGFVARSFSGNPKQLATILKAALAHRGTALIDVISPCVSFNNHDQSTKSYKYAKDKESPLHELGFVPYYEHVDVEIPAGEAKEVEFPDGSRLTFRALHEGYDPTDRFGALQSVHQASGKGEFLTGILYIHTAKPTLHDYLGLSEAPLVKRCLKLGPEVLKECLEELM